MKPIVLFILAFLLFFQHVFAQLGETFSDSNFTQNPIWTGTDSGFLVNSNHQLQSSFAEPNAIFYLSTPNTLATSAQWQFYVQLAFNTSSLNYVDVYLLASDSNLTYPSNTGYFLRLGGTNDDICLYRKDNNAAVKIIDGEDGLLNSSNNAFTLTITRTAANIFMVTQTAVNGTTTFVGAATDSLYQTTGHFGFLIKQSTSSFFGKHFFDNILIQYLAHDTLPPSIDTVMVSNEHRVTVYFDEPLAVSSLSSRENYVINHNIGIPDSIVIDEANPYFVKLCFNQPLPLRTYLSLLVSNIADLSNNMILPSAIEFVCYQPRYNDLIIDEVMADPSPTQGLPEKEWIEIRNTSPFDIDLSGWCLQKKEDESGALGKYVLKKDSSVVLCASGSSAALMMYAPVLSVSNFPSLNNIADTLALLSPDKLHIHSIAYSNDWHENEVKKLGGWSLEMIDVTKACLGRENWSSSTNTLGGSPGKSNSVNGTVFAETPPALWYAFAKDSQTLTLQFKGSIDSTTGTNVNGYHIENYNGRILQAKPLPPLFDKVELDLNLPLQRAILYTINVEGISDCTGNVIGLNNKAPFGITEASAVKDIIVNEVLFNPLSNGYDYVELYNRSNKVIDLQTLLLGNRNNLNQPDNIISITAKNRPLLPGKCVVLTENRETLLQHYFVAEPDNIITATNLPSFNDDEGNVLLMNKSGIIIDELHYKDDWHFSLLNNVEGVSLERINSEAPTNDSHNWHSASSSSGYGTPTYKNSQSISNQSSEEFFTIEPQVISPNNDGTDDVLGIHYQFPDNGNVLNVLVFDAMGRLVARPVKNLLCGTTGNFFWHGWNENNQPLLSGIYVVYGESYGTNGKLRKAKKTIVVR